MTSSSRAFAWVALLSLGWTAAAQAQTLAPTAPAPTLPTVPAEIQPEHPAPGGIMVPGQGGSGPQTAVPAPLPPGTADTPGGSARNGVIPPPSTGSDPGMNRGAPNTGTMPVIPPPGSSGGSSTVVPR